MIRLSYEPSVQAVFSSVLPPFARVHGDPAHLRRRVSWPLLARATGLGQIQGGEIVLVPPGRGDKIIPHAAELAGAGVAALVVAGELAQEEVSSLHDSGMPVAVVGGDADVRRIQSEMEQYIIRRRRE